MFDIGVDIVDIKRIKKTLERDDGAFLGRVFTEKEILNSSKALNKEDYFAKLFSFKESFAKAKGTGFVSLMKPNDIEFDCFPEDCLVSGASFKVSVNNKKVANIADVKFMKLNGNIVCRIILRKKNETFSE